MDQVEGTKLGYGLLCLSPGDSERGNRCANDTGTGAGELSGDESDTLDVGVAILAGEAEFGGKLGADGFAEEEGGGAAALLVECDLKGTADRVLAAVGEAGEENCETLFVAWGVGLAEDLDDFRVREPLRYGGASAETTTEIWVFVSTDFPVGGSAGD